MKGQAFLGAEEQGQLGRDGEDEVDSRIHLTSGSLT